MVFHNFHNKSNTGEEYQGRIADQRSDRAAALCNIPRILLYTVTHK